MQHIISENPVEHADQIEALYDVTFGPGHFAKTAERLREHNQSIPDLNRVAISDDGVVVGAVRMWPIEIETGEAILFVGPVAVHPDYRGEKLGLELCRQALVASQIAGWHGAIIIGSPDYFAPLGFSRASPEQFTFPGPQDMGRVMRLDLAGDMSRCSGRIIPQRMKSSGRQFV
ncbi:MAG: N-acetyltransferase [Hyphomonadaceae bacterium]